MGGRITVFVGVVGLSCVDWMRLLSDEKQLVVFDFDYS